MAWEAWAGSETTTMFRYCLSFSKISGFRVYWPQVVIRSRVKETRSILFRLMIDSVKRRKKTEANASLPECFKSAFFTYSCPILVWFWVNIASAISALASAHCSLSYPGALLTSSSSTMNSFCSLNLSPSICFLNFVLMTIAIKLSSTSNSVRIPSIRSKVPDGFSVESRP